jgi:hypothetical protein
LEKIRINCLFFVDDVDKHAYSYPIEGFKNMHNLPIEIVALLLISALAYWEYSRFFRPLLGKLRGALRPLEDQWTWTTRDGAVYEDVEVEGIETDEVIFQHKFGKARLPIALLSEDSLQKLNHGFQPIEPSESYATETNFDAEAGKQEKAADHRPLTEKGFHATA